MECNGVGLVPRSVIFNVQAQQRSWVPPEAVAAAADAAEQHGSWTCPTCTLNNAPQVAAPCPACCAGF